MEKPIQFVIPDNIESPKAYFSQETINQWYVVAHNLFKILSQNGFDKNKVNALGYQTENIKIFDGYCAFYFPDGGKAKEIFSCLNTASYGIAITTDNGEPHTHQHSSALNIVLNPDDPQQTVGFWAGDIKNNTQGISKHGKPVRHRDKFIIERGEVHGHIVSKNCLKYRQNNSEKFPLWKSLESSTTNEELSIFFLQLCDFTNVDLECYNDFHKFSSNDLNEYYDTLYTKIYHTLLLKNKIPLALSQEKKERDILYSSEKLPYPLKHLLGPIKEEIRSAIEIDKEGLYSILPKAPSDLSTEQVVDRYIDNFKDYDIFVKMKKRSPKYYMEWIHQKSFAKAYFVPLLYKVLEFCHKKGYTDLAQAMAYNIKDETGEWPQIDGEFQYKDDNNYINPEFEVGEEYKGETHEKRREYEYNGLIREYGKLGDAEEIKNQGRNMGMQIFNTITGDLLSKDDDSNGYEAIGAVMFLEKFIPHEFKFMKETRDKLFPGLSDQERHYIDDHIIHDEVHYQDIITGIKSMNLNKEEKELICNGIHKIYMGREFMFNVFANQIKSQESKSLL